MDGRQGIKLVRNNALKVISESPTWISYPNSLLWVDSNTTLAFSNGISSVQLYLVSVLVLVLALRGTMCSQNL